VIVVLLKSKTKPKTVQRSGVNPAYSRSTSAKDLQRLAAPSKEPSVYNPWYVPPGVILWRDVQAEGITKAEILTQKFVSLIPCSGISQKLGQSVSTGNFEFFSGFGDGVFFGHAALIAQTSTA